VIGAILLDWGHTLFDTAESVDFIVSWSAGRGTPIPVAEARRLWEHARRRSRSAEELAKGRDKNLAIHRSCWTALWSELECRSPGLAAALYEFETSADGWSPYSDTRALLEGLRDRRVPAVIVSDVPFDLRVIFAHYGLDDLVHAYVLSGEYGTIKPELRLFGIALEVAGVTAEEAVMVGDNQVNDGAAIDAGIRTLLLPEVGHGQPRGLGVVLDLVDASRL
jgi:HAD superfamily hydrolase (TIGR01509 family)